MARPLDPTEFCRSCGGYHVGLDCYGKPVKVAEVAPPQVTAESLTDAQIAALARVKSPALGPITSGDEVLYYIELSKQTVPGVRDGAREFLAAVWNTRAKFGRLAVTGETITRTQLTALFARHCDCRPLNLARGEDDHAAIHDCDTGILAEIQCALFDWSSSGADERRSKARAFCAEQLNRA